MRGLVLEGGGTKGSYHMGVYKAILEEGIEIDGVTGTSIGALNGAMIIQGDFDLCMKLWEEISYSMVIQANKDEVERLTDLKLDLSDLKFLGEKLKTIVQARGLDITPLKEHIDKYLDEDRVRKSAKDFGIVTFNLTDLKPIEVFVEDIPKGQLKDYLLASSYLPIFKSEKIGGKKYLDGGFFDNLPFGMLETKGYNDLILVRTHASGLIRKIDEEKLNAIVISPSDDLGGIFSFDQDTAKRNINMGYFDGLKAFRGLLGKYYYISPKNDDDYFFNMLDSLEEEQIKEMGKLIKLPEMPLKRCLFEYIIPKLGSVLGLSHDFTYEEFLIALLEERAKKSEIERFKIYSFEDLSEIVKCQGKLKKEVKSTKVLDKIIDIVDISMFFNKEDTVAKIGDILFC